jgi:hypothetical protein
MKPFNYDVQRGWIDAAIKLANSSPADWKVACPSCAHQYLSVRNLPSDEDCQEKQLYCEACHRAEYIRMTPKKYLQD